MQICGARIKGCVRRPRRAAAPRPPRPGAALSPGAAATSLAPASARRAGGQGERPAPARRSSRTHRFPKGQPHMVILGPLIDVILVAINLYIWAIIISAILSWLIAFEVINTRNRFVYTVLDFLWRITEPALRPIRNVLPNLGGIDISPIILILGLFFVQQVLGNVRYELAAGAGAGF
jgi:YggT family protein